MAESAVLSTSLAFMKGASCVRGRLATRLVSVGIQGCGRRSKSQGTSRLENSSATSEAGVVVNSLSNGDSSGSSLPLFEFSLVDSIEGLVVISLLDGFFVINRYAPRSEKVRNLHARFLDFVALAGQLHVEMRGFAVDFAFVM